MRCVVIFVSLTLVAALSVANDEPEEGYDWATSEKDACSTGTSAEMTGCIRGYFHAIDAELNQVYEELVNALVDPSPVRTAQRAWLKFRDAECATNTGPRPYDGYGRYACMTALTKERVKQLRWHLAQECNGCPPRR